MTADTLFAIEDTKVGLLAIVFELTTPEEIWGTLLAFKTALELTSAEVFMTALLSCEKAGRFEFSAP